MENINDSDIKELSSLEQSSHHLLTQRQSYQTQLVETESALNEIETSNIVYKIVGHVMILSEKEKIKNELLNKKEMLDIRIKSLIKQEEKIKEKSMDLRNRVMKNLKE